MKEFCIEKLKEKIALQQQKVKHKIFYREKNIHQMYMWRTR